MPAEPAQELFVLDTSSITWIRRSVPVPERKSLLAELEALAVSGLLIFPKEVADEIKSFHDKNDQLTAWIRRCEDRATRFGLDVECLQEVMQGPARAVLDTEKTRDDADPYVLALALSRAQAGSSVTVLTEERRDTPDKISMTTACGLLGLVDLRMEPFLRHQGLWQRPQ